MSALPREIYSLRPEEEAAGDALLWQLAERLQDLAWRNNQDIDRLRSAQDKLVNEIAALLARLEEPTPPGQTRRAVAGMSAYIDTRIAHICRSASSVVSRLREQRGAMARLRELLGQQQQAHS